MKKHSLIVGTMTWGRWGSALNTTEMANRIEGALELGLNRFDHADIYGDYTTEAEFGAALKQANVTREAIELITKCGIQMTRGRANKVKHYQYDTAYIIDSAEQSLRNLGTDYLDLFLLHRPSPLLDTEEVGLAVATLLDQGKIKSFGLSNFLPHQVESIMRFAPVEANQIQCSITHTDSMYDGTLDQAKHLNIEPMAWSPLGVLFKNPDDEAVVRIRAVADDLMKKYDTDLAGLALAFLAKHPSKISPVVGTTQINRLADAKKGFEIALELEDWFVLLEAAKGTRVP
ncbi:MAG: Oxidoreductase YdhF [Flavobacteriaceae bacterium]|nr:MAG: Oxidoreductase YdhF [Flavobacteriaceae bacterium]